MFDTSQVVGTGISEASTVVFGTPGGSHTERSSRGKNSESKGSKQTPKVRRRFCKRHGRIITFQIAGCGWGEKNRAHTAHTWALAKS